ncbi:MAG: MOSC domain-containing protein [Myxococcota bacterium]
MISAEMQEAWRQLGFAVSPGALGENVTTRGLDLHALSTGTVLRIRDALLVLTGARNPCAQIEARFPKLLKQLVVDDGAEKSFRAGVMAVVVAGGTVAEGDAILVARPPGKPRPLRRV